MAKQELGELRRRVSPRESYRLPDLGLQWHHDILGELVARLERVASERDGLRASIERRLQSARRFQTDLVKDAERWRRTVARIPTTNVPESFVVVMR